MTGRFKLSTSVVSQYKLISDLVHFCKYMREIADKTLLKLCSFEQGGWLCLVLISLHIASVYIAELQWPCLLLNFLLVVCTFKLCKLKWWEEATALFCCFYWLICSFTDNCLLLLLTDLFFYLVTAMTGSRELSEC